MNSQLTIYTTEKFHQELSAMFLSQTITPEDFRSNLAASIRQFVLHQDRVGVYKPRATQTERADILEYQVSSLRPSNLADITLTLPSA